MLGVLRNHEIDSSQLMGVPLEYHVVTDGLAELRAAHRHNLDNDENDELKAS